MAAEITPATRTRLLPPWSAVAAAAAVTAAAAKVWANVKQNDSHLEPCVSHDTRISVGFPVKLMCTCSAAAAAAVTAAQTP